MSGVGRQVKIAQHFLRDGIRMMAYPLQDNVRASAPYL
jgi:hypothetical protein